MIAILEFTLSSSKLMSEPVLVDKPFATSSEEADEVIEIANARGLILTCYQNRRWVHSSCLSDPEAGMLISDRMATFRPSGI